MKGKARRGKERGESVLCNMLSVCCSLERRASTLDPPSVTWSLNVTAWDGWILLSSLQHTFWKQDPRSLDWDFLDYWGNWSENLIEMCTNQKSIGEKNNEKLQSHCIKEQCSRKWCKNRGAQQVTVVFSILYLFHWFLFVCAVTSPWRSTLQRCKTVCRHTPPVDPLPAFFKKKKCLKSFPNSSTGAEKNSICMERQRKMNSRPTVKSEGVSITHANEKALRVQTSVKAELFLNWSSTQQHHFSLLDFHLIRLPDPENTPGGSGLSESFTVKTKNKILLVEIQKASWPKSEANHLIRPSFEEAENMQILKTCPPKMIDTIIYFLCLVSWEVLRAFSEAAIKG